MRKILLPLGLIFLSSISQGHSAINNETSPICIICAKPTMPETNITLSDIPKISTKEFMAKVDLLKYNPVLPPEDDDLRQYFEDWRNALEKWRKAVENSRMAGEFQPEVYQNLLSKYKLGIANYREGISAYREVVKFGAHKRT